MGRITKTECKSLLAWRQAHQLTQVEAAARFGITQPQWSFYENGTAYPRRQLAKRIADGTGLSLAVVLGVADESSSESGTFDQDSQIS